MMTVCSMREKIIGFLFSQDFHASEKDSISRMQSAGLFAQVDHGGHSFPSNICFRDRKNQRSRFTKMGGQSDATSHEGSVASTDIVQRRTPLRRRGEDGIPIRRHRDSNLSINRRTLCISVITCTPPTSTFWHVFVSGVGFRRRRDGPRAFHVTP